MPDEIDLGIFLQNSMESLDASIVRPVLEMHQYRHPKFLSDLSDPLKVFGVTLDAEFLLTDADGSAFQIRFDLFPRFLDVGDLVGEENKLS